MSNTTNESATRLPDESAVFRLIFVLSFVLLFAVAVVGQTAGWQWRSWLPGAEGVKSMTGGVKAAVYTFMSHLL
jgi:light-harvesting complex 1 beta chain